MAKTNLVTAAVLVLVSLSITFGALELITRVVVGAPWPEKMPLLRVQPDQNLGWRMLPSDVHYTYLHRVELNSLGFRGSEVTQKVAGEYRILAIGDSHIYGQGILDDELITRRIEQILNTENSNCTFRVINLGVRAYNLNQEVALFEEIGLSLQPDHVVLFPYINDFQDVNIKDRYERFKHMDWYMFDISAKPGGEALHKWNRRQLFRKSAFLGWVYDRFNAWKSRGNFEELILLGRLDNADHHQLSVAVNHLEKFHVLSKNHNLTFELAAIPVANQLIDSYPNNQFQTILRRFAENRGIAYIDLLNPLRDYYQTHDRLPIIPFDGHYDSQAHRVMGQVVARHLRKSISGCGAKASAASVAHADIV